MKISEEQKKQKWILGVSGGADSMALLAMCVERHMDVIVAHMNYQKRDTANRDMEGVRAFCAQHDVPCICRLQDKPCVGNFQAFARKERYDFYRELIKQYEAVGVMVAHQLDDHLETYLMQKQRGSMPMTYGISETAYIYGCYVLRPLLSYTKAQLEAYCDEHHVPHYLDESNLSDDYTRNRIRHQIIEPMTYEEKLVLRDEIVQANKKLKHMQEEADAFLKNWQNDVSSLCSLEQKKFTMVLQRWLFPLLYMHLSQKECDMVYKLLHTKANNWTRTITSAYDMRMEYGKLSMIKKDEDGYHYTYEHLCYEQTPYFTCAITGSSVEAVTLYPDDFPIVIRNAQPGDAITLRFGTKKLNRWFIDRKISQEDRKKWPVVVNAAGKIVLVPKIGCDISHFSNNPNLFVIK